MPADSLRQLQYCENLTTLDLRYRADSIAIHNLSLFPHLSALKVKSLHCSHDSNVITSYPNIKSLCLGALVKGSPILAQLDFIFPNLENFESDGLFYPETKEFCIPKCCTTLTFLARDTICVPSDVANLRIKNRDLSF